MQHKAVCALRSERKLSRRAPGGGRENSPSDYHTERGNIMIDWKRKLSSRKLWAAVAGIVAGLAMVFGLDEGVISSVAGSVVSLASVVVYIITEGKVDEKAVDSGKGAAEEKQ